jgi:UDP-sugar transporter A1/2/3
MDLFSIKNLALAALVLQNSFLVIFMRYSLTIQGVPLYASSTAVASMEVVKLVSCLCMVFLEGNGFQVLYQEIIEQPSELLNIAVPSIVYTIQNNVLYFALSHLDAATFQVGYQLKILTTAIFSIFMLGRTISTLQWFALILLTIGVSLAQIASNNSTQTRGNTSVGFIAVGIASILSGFAGVYFEKMLKTKSSIWIRNIQMCLTSIPVAVLSAYYTSDRTSVIENGFFYGFSHLVIFVILLQAIGGLVVAVVVKYADNILKGFAAGFSILTSCILSYFFFEFTFTLLFVMGALLVNISMYLYSYTSTTSMIVKSNSFKDASQKV